MMMMDGPAVDSYYSISRKGIYVAQDSQMKGFKLEIFGNFDKQKMEYHDETQGTEL